MWSQNYNIVEKHLGSAIESGDFKASGIKLLVGYWIDQLKLLTKIAE